MAGQAYHLIDFAVLSVTTDSGDTDYVGGVRNVSISGEVEIDELWTADSTEVAELKQREFRVPLEIEYAKFEGDFVQEWLGGDGSSATEWADNSDPQEFELEMEQPATNAPDQIEVTVEKIVADEMPIFDGSHDDWATWDWSPTGYALTNFDVITEQ